MNRFVLALLAAAAAGGLAASFAWADQDEKPDLVTILAAPHPETQLMAMTLTLQSLQQGGEGTDAAVRSWR